MNLAREHRRLPRWGASVTLWWAGGGQQNGAGIYGKEGSIISVMNSSVAINTAQYVSAGRLHDRGAALNLVLWGGMDGWAGSGSVAVPRICKPRQTCKGGNLGSDVIMRWCFCVCSQAGGGIFGTNISVAHTSSITNNSAVQVMPWVVGVRTGFTPLAPGRPRQVTQPRLAMV